MRKRREVDQRLGMRLPALLGLIALLVVGCAGPLAPEDGTLPAQTPGAQTPGVETPEGVLPEDMDTPEGEVIPEEMETPEAEVVPGELETPEVETPEVETPEVETPEVETPEAETPEAETATPEAETPEAGETPADGAEDVEIVMELSMFMPPEITIPAGTTVVWVNNDSFEHNVTSGPEDDPTDLFDADVAAGESFSFTFEEPGTYPYHCDIHPGMVGTVIVE